MVINDVNMINSAFMNIDENKDQCSISKYVLTYDMYLERQSKLYKLLRN